MTTGKGCDRGLVEREAAMKVDLKARWEEAVSFEQWLDEAEEHVNLWRSIYERAEVPEEFLHGSTGGPYRFLVLAEDWCGDAVNTVPWLARLAESVDGWELRVLQRDHNLDLMATHTTNGSLSIPVVMALDADYREIDWWGPRPEELQEWVLGEGMELPKKERYRKVRRWYARDRGRTTLEELMVMLGVDAARQQQVV